MKKDNHYFAWGLTAVCVVCAVLLIYDIAFRDSIVMNYAGILLAILAPVLYGAAMAYLLSPVVNWIERIILRRSSGTGGWQRAASIVLTWLVVLASLYAIFSILVPELYNSVKQLVANAQDYYFTVRDWILHLVENNPDFTNWSGNLINEYYSEALSWINNNLVPQLQVAVQAVTGGVMGVFVFLKDLLLGVVVSVYLLASKEGFAAGSCRLCYTLLPEGRAAWLIRGVKAVDRIFSGFVRGKLLDSLIIGILCFFFSSLFEFPYAPLISVVVGVTNVIPFFGPFLGAIPSAFLILLDEPIKSLYFLIFILALQQFDGNILGPKILGSSTGISGLWVMVAILVGGGLWGVPGMFLGVPIFACIHTGVRSFCAYRLQKKGLPVDLASYATHGPVRPENGAAAEKPE